MRFRKTIDVVYRRFFYLFLSQIVRLFWRRRRENLKFNFVKYSDNYIYHWFNIKMPHFASTVYLFHFLVNGDHIFKHQ